MELSILLLNQKARLLPPQQRLRTSRLRKAKTSAKKHPTLSSIICGSSISQLLDGLSPEHKLRSGLSFFLCLDSSFFSQALSVTVIHLA